MKQAFLLAALCVALLPLSAWPCTAPLCPPLEPVFPALDAGPLPTNVQLVMSSALRSPAVITEVFNLELSDGGSPDGGIPFTVVSIDGSTFCGALVRLIPSTELQPNSRYRIIRDEKEDSGFMTAETAPGPLEFDTGSGADHLAPPAPVLASSEVTPFPSFCFNCGFPSGPSLNVTFAQSAEGPLWYVPVSLAFRTGGGIDRFSTPIACASGQRGVAPGEREMEVFAMDIAGNISASAVFTVNPQCVGVDPCAPGDGGGPDGGFPLTGGPLDGDQGCGCSSVGAPIVALALALLVRRRREG